MGLLFISILMSVTNFMLMIFPIIPDWNVNGISLYSRL